MTPLIKRIPRVNPDGACRMYIGKGLCVILDPPDFKYYSRYRIFAQRSKTGWYACRRHKIGGKVLTIRIHREIAQTPHGMQCHHINRNTLDDRRRNLMNVTPSDHARFF